MSAIVHWDDIQYCFKYILILNASYYCNECLKEWTELQRFGLENNIPCHT